METIFTAVRELLYHQSALMRCLFTRSFMPQKKKNVYTERKILIKEKHSITHGAVWSL